MELTLSAAGLVLGVGGEFVQSVWPVFGAPLEYFCGTQHADDFVAIKDQKGSDLLVEEQLDGFIEPSIRPQRWLLLDCAGAP
ncbi:hypothetical protein ACHABX_08920 [Nesterenkonia halotolerans]|uniref:hypothetical protein n=1 Tax=Nesterenkonia halotolerans TaxID=225325 RepID=UPI003EE46CBF